MAPAAAALSPRPATWLELPRFRRRQPPAAFPFPALRRGGAKQVEVTVTVPKQAPVTGVLVRIDDFFVSLREPSGEYRAFNRGPGVTVSSTIRWPLITSCWIATPTPTCTT